MNIFFENELKIAQDKRKSSKLSENISIITDGNAIGKFFMTAFQDIHLNEEVATSNIVFAFADCYNTENAQEFIDKLTNLNKSSVTQRLVIAEIVPEISIFPSSATELAEREYEFISLNAEGTEFDYLRKIENTARMLVKGGIDVVLLRMSNIFGPDITCRNAIDISEITDKIFKSEKIEVLSDDNKKVHSLTYIRDVISSVFLAATKLKNGNVYNVSSFQATICDIKSTIFTKFKQRFEYKADIANGERTFFCLCPLKIASSGFVPTNINESVYCTVCAHLNTDYDVSFNLNQYCGKLQRLKSLEMEMLSEVDRICKKHGIKYFLSGGTLLGAVRNGKSIEWDDDLDIGMIREEFEKFRKVCPKELDSSRFAYASYLTEKNCHYFFDKIRIKGTYFSTKFSNNYKIEDGVFLDIFIYDNTSSDEKKMRKHINLIKLCIRMLNVKWTNRADRSMNMYFLSKIMRPILKFVSFSTLHKLAEKALKKYRSKTNSQYLIDGTGLNINNGSFLKSLVEETTIIDFEGFKAPIPVGYNEFLKFVYGEDYLKKPSVSERNGTHNFVRLDLGNYLFENKPESISSVSLDGELF